MKKGDPFTEVFSRIVGSLALLLVALGGVAFFGTLTTEKNYLANKLWLILPLLTAVVSLTFIAYWFATLSRHPYPLKVALLGAPHAGKTVYLTVLFHELQALRRDPVFFQPYGLETIETVTRNLKELSSGFWLKPTSEDSVFFFRANAVVRTAFFRRRYTVEIGDYAGERIAEFDSTSERWLHRTEYFKYAVSSDVLFLAVDGQLFAQNDHSALDDAQLKLIAAVQVLIQEKGVNPGSRMQMPVALLILKADILMNSDMTERYVISRLHKLINVLEATCRHSKVFLVSAIGPDHDEDRPPSVLYPINVVEPMIWALHLARRH